MSGHQVKQPQVMDFFANSFSKLKQLSPGPRHLANLAFKVSSLQNGSAKHSESIAVFLSVNCLTSTAMCTGTWNEKHNVEKRENIL